MPRIPRPPIHGGWDGKLPAGWGGPPPDGSRKPRESRQPAGGGGEAPPGVMELHLAPPPSFEAGGGGHYEPAAAWPLVIGLTREAPDSPVLTTPIIPWGSEQPGRYILHKHLGQGAFGSVDMVQDRTQGNTFFALKKMKVDNENRQKLVVREVVMHRQLNHKNICRLEESYKVDPDNVNMLLESCIMDLEKYLKLYLIKLKGGQKSGEIKHISLAMLSGLLYMHGKGIVHRDLKVQNILMKVAGGIKICDFGLSRKVDSSSITKQGRRRLYSTRVGTVTTMAPEMLMSVRDYGCEVDMWSVACIISKLFVGHTYPRLKDADLDIMNKHHAQLNAITALCGDINYPAGVPPYMTRGNVRQVRASFQYVVEGDKDAMDLMSRAFTLEPYDRSTASQLRDQYFFHNGAPPPCPTMMYPFSY